MIMAIIGTGLIGGSMALIAKEKGFATKVIGVEANAAHAAKAVSLHLVDEVLSLEEAVRRMSSLPAQKFGLQNRGLLREGFAADIVIFDEKEVADLSTYEKPHAYSKGFQYVLVNGELVVDKEKHTGVRKGQTLSPANNKIL